MIKEILRADPEHGMVVFRLLRNKKI
ncbi:hypothetical protein KGM_200579 [Danaus plexippus plexippus]|uniref:Uncharacterized protein n=1 Tax=Danaus plexippus plexippus TaxID=278856 RepID=A0A212F2Y4_DANPL|nr:hypothetical protein KGM_200579 [Danaus plexippus plexippus]